MKEERMNKGDISAARAIIDNVLYDTEGGVCYS